MRSVLFFLATLAFGCVASHARASGILDELSAEDAARVESGQQVLTTENLPDYPWPRAKIYQTSNMKPEEIMAVFFDYNNAFRYVPNCRVSKISREISPTVFDVDYEVDVPILPDEKYTAQNSLRRIPGGGYAVDWRVIKASSIESSVGSLRVEPFRGGSLICYANLVKPASKAAGLLRSIAMSQMKDTVSAILREAASQKAETGNALAARIAIMEAALDAKPTSSRP